MNSQFLTHLAGCAEASKGESEPVICGAVSSTTVEEHRGFTTTVVSRLTPVVTAAMVYAAGNC